MIAPARLAAYESLRAIDTGRMDLPAALAATRARLTDPRDIALAADIVTGTLRWRGALDYAIARAVRRPLARLDPEVVDILRLSLYQLTHLDRVPAAAVVDDGVELAKRAGKRSASGLVNAVLRAQLRSKDRLPLPARPTLADDRPQPDTSEYDAALDYLSITQSHPRWLAARWLDRYGFAAAETWTRFNNEPAPLTLRVNTFRTSSIALIDQLAAAGVRAVPASHVPDALIVEQGNPLRAPDLAPGLFLLQNEASQLVARFVGAEPGEHVLDACAAPGGKTVVMANLMRNEGLIVTGDRRARRMRLLRTTLTDLGVTSARLVQLDLLQPLPFRSGTFDRVLVDAPCSGLGTIRRDPDIRWRRTEQDLHESAARQLTMLRQAADAVRAGGLLVYATCSSEPEENDQVVDRFLASAPAFAIDERGFLRTSPVEDGLEAFFAARLRRRL
jgi:16S rRNA (cytosine967-C5)-methyltransferase